MLFRFEFLLCFPFISVLGHGYDYRRPMTHFDIPQQSVPELTCGPCLNGHCTAPATCTCKSGYSLDTNLDCAPVCAQPCVNGVCVAPNECVCVQGYHLDPASLNTCIRDCPEGCVNGTCVKGSSQCNPGKENIRPTLASVHSPVCTPACENSVCLASGECSCHHGYEKIDSGNRCEPICNNSCLNADCVAPETCECHPGYKFDNNSDTSCSPVCSGCKSGICVTPEVCECFGGYRPITNTTTNITDCEPICEPPCNNGKCIAAGVCWPELGGQNKMTCQDTCKGKCVDGKCVPNCPPGFTLSLVEGKEPFCMAVCKSTCGNGTCVSPDKCDCSPGYEQKVIGQICQPVCKNGCVNGACIAPEQCECQKGYRFDVNSTNSCSAHCSNGCDSGTCVQPDVCQCFPGYFLVTNAVSNETSCQLNCQPTCENGTCTVADLCLPQLVGSNGTRACDSNCKECREGSCLEFCDVGYELKDNGTNCQLHCRPTCRNGTCTVVDLCLTQLVGSNGTRVCDSNCKDCRDGTCLEFCESGYELKVLDTNVTKCEPICDTICINATCTAPGTCTCLEGYRPENENHTSCKPFCSTGCPNGVCVEPDMCRCDFGYKLQGFAHGCTPYCTMDCGNGTCIKPDVCHCDEGYVSAVKENKTETRHCIPTTQRQGTEKQKLENTEESAESSNKVMYIALSALAGSGVVAAALAVYWLKFYKTGSYLTQELCHPQQMNSAF